MIDSAWRPSNKYPELSSAKRISIDLETCDPYLEDKGPGAIRKDGYVCGFSIGTDDGFRDYFPIKHPSDNVENPEAAIAWLKDVAALNIPKVGAKLLYDTIWLKGDFGIDLKGKKLDVQVAEPLINENKYEYNLESLSRDWLNESKDTTLLYAAATELLHLKPKAKTKDEYKSVVDQARANLWRLPARFVGPYGIGDIDLPLRIFDKQYKKLEEDDLLRVFDLEAEVLDLLVEMFFQGVPVDINKAEEVADSLQLRLDNVMRQVRSRVGFDVDIWSGPNLAKACDTLGIQYLKTEKGNPSFKAEWLEAQSDPFLSLIVKARQLDRGGAVFVREKIINSAVNGRIHPQFWQVKSEKHGTVAGRFSSSNPNAQQFPARNEEIAALVRGLIIAEPGKRFGMFDYSQQEPRVTVHFAYLLGLRGALEARQKYIDDPSTDFHQMTAEIADITRKHAKTINLGLSYGMGEVLLAEELGLPVKEARVISNKYHAAVPYIKLLAEQCSKVAKKRGFVRTILGRRCHFDSWGPAKWSKGIVPKSYEAALAEFGPPIQRYFLHKSVNRVVQGSSADMIKVALVLCRRAGYIPYMTVHDENDYPIENLKQAKEIHDIMVHETSKYLGLMVPLKVDVELGNDWGHCELVEV